jgi:hypothetical protein
LDSPELYYYDLFNSTVITLVVDGRWMDVF